MLHRAWGASGHPARVHRSHRQLSWRVLDSGVRHPERTLARRSNRYAACVHAQCLVGVECGAVAVRIARIEVRDLLTGLWDAVYDPDAGLKVVDLANESEPVKVPDS